MAVLTCKPQIAACAGKTDPVRPIAAGQPARSVTIRPAARPRLAVHGIGARIAGTALVLLLGSVAAVPVLAQPAGGPPPAVTVAAPLSRKVAQWDEYTARIEPSARVEIRPRVSGQVQDVHFTDGALVRAGDLLFTIDQRPFRIAVDSARADLARAGARLSLAERQVQRYAPLVRDRFATEAEQDNRVGAFREAQAGIAAAQAALRQAELNLEFTEIRAPRPGRVSDRRVDAGNLVREGETLLTTLVALDPVYANFDASEAEYLRAARRAAADTRPSGRAGSGGTGSGPGSAPGNAQGSAQGSALANALTVQLRLADEAQFTREGRVDFVDSGFDPRSGTIRSRAVIPNPDLFLVPGSFARLRLFGGDAPALLVPDAAIMADQSGRMVLTVTPDGTVAPRPVQLGPLVEGLRVVRAGLSADDRVIVGGLHRARPGGKVTAEPGRIAPAQLAATTTAAPTQQ